MPAPSNLDNFKTTIVANGVESEFLKVTGLQSLDELSPLNFDNSMSKAQKLVTSMAVPSPAPVAAPATGKSDADARTRNEYEEASDFLYGFKHLTIRYPPRKQVSSFVPCPVSMFLILHKMNLVLCDHFYFLRSAPDYHPALLRVYFGILFIIQTLRAMHFSNSLGSQDQHDFLKRFLDAFPPETLAIPAPLLHIFKSLCCSQPEIPQYGYVTPHYDNKADTQSLSDYPSGDRKMPWYLPDIAGILSLLQWQKTTGSFKKGFHPDFNTTSDTTFRGRLFPADRDLWTAAQAWSLLLPGIEHPFESGKKLNEAFFEDRYDDLDLPTVSGNNLVNTLSRFTFLNGKLTWFSRLRDIAGVAAKYFPGSGSLADCSPSGPPVCQIKALLSEPSYERTLTDSVTSTPTKTGESPRTTKVFRYSHGDPPTGFTKDTSYYDDIAYKLETPSRELPQMAVIMAGASLVRMTYGPGHYVRQYDAPDIEGPFFDIRPLESSSSEEGVFYGISDSIKKAIKDKA
nr:MAG: coat protein [Dicephalospora rufocornea partitivirus 1]